MSIAPVDYDPQDPLTDLDPYPTFKRLRDEQPLYYNAEHDFYALSRFEDVRAASVDFETYASGYGTVLELLTDPKEFVEVLQSILFEDPPVHDVHRKIMTRSFGHRRIAVLEPRIRELCGHYLEPLRDEPTFDFMGDFALKLPRMVIGELLGVPEDEQSWLQHKSDVLVGSQGPGRVRCRGTRRGIRLLPVQGR